MQPLPSNEYLIEYWEGIILKPITSINKYQTLPTNNSAGLTFIQRSSISKQHGICDMAFGQLLAGLASFGITWGEWRTKRAKYPRELLLGRNAFSIVGRHDAKRSSEMAAEMGLIIVADDTHDFFYAQ